MTFRCLSKPDECKDNENSFNKTVNWVKKESCTNIEAMASLVHILRYTFSVISANTIVTWKPRRSLSLVLGIVVKVVRGHRVEGLSNVSSDIFE